jgi:branched-chain amino acid transport system substrate-binding protein
MNGATGKISAANGAMGRITAMSITRRLFVGSASMVPFMPARAATSLRIGVLGDQSGPYRDISGPTAIACVNQAIEDFNPATRGMTVEVVSGDHQNKADIGAAIAREWFDRQGVDMIVDVPNSAVALAVSALTKERNKVFIDSTAATADLTGAQCTPNTIHWTYDTAMLARVMCRALTHGAADTWFFITADYAYGHAMQRDATRIIGEAGGKVIGSISYPFPGTSDFSSFLLQAQASGAKYIGLANAGADTVSSIKQAGEFGIGKGKQSVVGMQVFLPDAQAMGLPLAQGLLLTETFYWDLNDRTRSFTQRMLGKSHGEYPCMSQAGAYAGTLHYLKAVAELGIDLSKRDGAAVVERMKALPTDDDAFGQGTVRADGLGQHPAYLFQVKTPAASKSHADCYTLLDTIPAEKAFATLAEAGCPLVR